MVQQTLFISADHVFKESRLCHEKKYLKKHQLIVLLFFYYYN